MLITRIPVWERISIHLRILLKGTLLHQSALDAIELVYFAAGKIFVKHLLCCKRVSAELPKQAPRSDYLVVSSGNTCRLLQETSSLRAPQF